RDLHQRLRLRNHQGRSARDADAGPELFAEAVRPARAVEGRENFAGPKRAEGKRTGRGAGLKRSGRARRSARAVVRTRDGGARGATRPTTTRQFGAALRTYT